MAINLAKKATRCPIANDRLLRIPGNIFIFILSLVDRLALGLSGAVLLHLPHPSPCTRSPGTSITHFAWTGYPERNHSGLLYYV